MGIFALYDTVSIQKYIYSSNRLRDNQGASALVEQCFSQLLTEAVRKEKAEGIFSKICMDWNTYPEKVQFLEDAKVDCEVLYIGGGNALLYFRDETGAAWRKVNETFSAALFEKMPGLSVVTEIQEDTGEFGKDLDFLFKKLQLKKYRSRGVQDVPCLSVTRQCAWSGKPAVGQGADGNWIAEEIVKKREASGKEIAGDQYKEIRELSGVSGEQWVAVVHIDGNRMGDSIRKLTEGKDAKSGIRQLRKFSIETDEVYHTAYEEMKAWCAAWIQESEDARLTFYQGKTEPPFRKIYGAGDDLTFLCYAPLAIRAAEHFLKNLEKQQGCEGITMSACAGIAFAKPGYPFAKAYEIAEACCRSAKKRTEEEMGSYLDFQVIYGGLNSLSQMRKKQQEENRIRMLRPYRVADSKRDELKNFYLVSDWIADSKIARSKWKELRGAYSAQESAQKESEERIRRRYNKTITELLNLLNKNGLLNDSGASGSAAVLMLWDGLETMDLYIKRPGAWQGGGR